MIHVGIYDNPLKAFTMNGWIEIDMKDDTTKPCCPDCAKRKDEIEWDIQHGYAVRVFKKRGRPKKEVSE